MRNLRAVRAHGGPFVLVALVVAVAVAAAVLATSVTGTGGDAVRPATSVPLLLLALVVVPVPALELARRRRDELALVRVRGAYGARLVTLVAGESVIAVTAGGVVGVGMGVGAVRFLHVPWDTPTRLGGAELAAAGLVTAGAAVLAAGCAWLVVREPLATAIRRPTWTGPGASASFLGLVSGVGALVVASLAAYQSRAGAGGSLVLAGSALIGFAVGQVVVWALPLALTRAGLGVATRSTGLLLGLRRTLATEHATRLRAVIAAGVVVAAAGSAVTATDGWADESARLRQAAPLRLDLPDATALATLLLTRRLDPDGRWLMAGAVIADRPEAENRVAWLDLARFDRVAGGFLDVTPAEVGPATDALRNAAPVQVVTGETLEVQAGSGVAVARPVTVTLEYVGDAGFLTSAEVTVAAGSVARSPVDDCAEACVVLRVSASAAVEVAGLRLGEADLLTGMRWVADGSGDVTRPGGLILDEGLAGVPADAVAPAPVLTAGDPDFGDGVPIVPGIGGSSRPVASVGSRAALPLVEGAGLLVDLPVALAAARGLVVTVDQLVLARADTPEQVLAGLRDAGAQAPEETASTGSVLGTRTLAEERVRRVVGLAAALLGLLVVASGRRRRVRASRREQAALRLVGVTARELRRAVLVEAILLATVAALATAVGGWVAAVTVVDGAGLVPTGPTRLPFGSAASSTVLAGVALAVAVVVAGGSLLARLGVMSRSAPMVLLSEAPSRATG